MIKFDDVRNLLQLTIDSIEKTIELETKLQESFNDLMKNVNAGKVDGLKSPNLFPYIQELNLQKQIILTLKFRVECLMEDNNR